jgi:hypothetical protein
LYRIYKLEEHTDMSQMIVIGGNLISNIAQKQYLLCGWSREVGATAGGLEGERLASVYQKDQTGKIINNKDGMWQ